MLNNFSIKEPKLRDPQSWDFIKNYLQDLASVQSAIVERHFLRIFNFSLNKILSVEDIYPSPTVETTIKANLCTNPGANPCTNPQENIDNEVGSSENVDYPIIVLGNTNIVLSGGSKLKECVQENIFEIEVVRLYFFNEIAILRRLNDLNIESITTLKNLNNSVNPIAENLALQAIGDNNKIQNQAQLDKHNHQNHDFLGKFVSYHQQGNDNKLKLLGVTLFKVRHGGNFAKYYCLGLNLFKIKLFGNLKKFYLLGIPCFKQDVVQEINDDVKLLLGSNFFNLKYYQEQSSYVPQNVIEACEHYLNKGWKLGLNPSSVFDTSFYLCDNPDVKDSGICPLLHFIKEGNKQGRATLPYKKQILTETVNDHDFYLLQKEYLKRLGCDSLHDLYSKRAQPKIIEVKELLEQTSKTFLILLPEHIGDIIASEPIARYLKVKYDCKVAWVVFKKYASLLENNRMLDYVVAVDSFDEYVEIQNQLPDCVVEVNCIFNGRQPTNCAIPVVNTNESVTFYNYYKNKSTLLNTFYKLAGLPTLDITPIFWDDQEKRNLDSLGDFCDSTNFSQNDYIVVHLLSNNKTRSLSSEQATSLVSILTEKFNLKVIEIGGNLVKSESSNFKSLVHIRDFSTIYNLIKNSTLFVGVDSCFLHMANCAHKYAVTMQCILENRFYHYTLYSGEFYKAKNSMPGGVEYIYCNKSDLKKLEPDVIANVVYKAYQKARKIDDKI